MHIFATGIWSNPISYVGQTVIFPPGSQSERGGMHSEVMAMPLQ